MSRDQANQELSLLIAVAPILQQCRRDRGDVIRAVAAAVMIFIRRCAGERAALSQRIGGDRLVSVRVRMRVRGAPVSVRVDVESSSPQSGGIAHFPPRPLRRDQQGCESAENEIDGSDMTHGSIVANR